MYLTDAEARQQICPFISYCINESDVGQWRQSAIMTHQTCQASDCKMAWRERQDGKGYCGMAGKPTGWPTEQEAKESFIARKKSQISILKAQLFDAEKALKLAE